MAIYSRSIYSFWNGLYSCFSWGGNLYFLHFLQTSFITSNYWMWIVEELHYWSRMWGLPPPNHSIISVAVKIQFCAPFEVLVLVLLGRVGKTRYRDERETHRWLNFFSLEREHKQRERVRERERERESALKKNDKMKNKKLFSVFSRKLSRPAALCFLSLSLSILPTHPLFYPSPISLYFFFTHFCIFLLYFIFCLFSSVFYLLSFIFCLLSSVFFLSIFIFILHTSDLSSYCVLWSFYIYFRIYCLRYVSYV